MRKRQAKKIAKWVCDVGYRNTYSGNYIVDFDVVARNFGMKLKNVIKNKNKIADFIDYDERILSETWLDDGFDMNFCGEFEE